MTRILIVLFLLPSSDNAGKKEPTVKQIEEDLFGDASDISSDEEGKRKLTIRDSDSEGDRPKETPKKKKAKVRRAGRLLYDYGKIKK